MLEQYNNTNSEQIKPTISIFVTGDENEQKSNEMNSKNTHKDSKFKKNLLDFNSSLTNSEILDKSFVCSALGNRRSGSNRKCLSRLNLSIYNQATPILVTKTTNESTNSKPNQSTCLLAPSNSFRCLKKKSFNQLNQLLNNTTANNKNVLQQSLLKDSNLVKTNEKWSNYISNLEIDKTGSNFKGSSSLLNRQSSIVYPLLKSSNLNLFKSSNSLNALDLELVDSISISSYDRLSFYSLYANSDYELSSTLNLTEENKANKNANKEEISEESNLHLFEKSLKLNNHQNKKVINWLEKI